MPLDNTFFAVFDEKSAAHTKSMNGSIKYGNMTTIYDITLTVVIFGLLAVFCNVMVKSNSIIVI